MAGAISIVSERPGASVFSVLNSSTPKPVNSRRRSLSRPAVQVSVTFVRRRVGASSTVPQAEPADQNQRTRRGLGATTNVAVSA